MILRGTIGRYKISLTIAKTMHLIGVNSEVGDGRHILMWDFDDTPLSEVERTLCSTQFRYNLSDIFILRSKEPDNYLAYCFTVCEWQHAVAIVTQTEHVDWQFVRFGVFRGKFTLRVTPKGGLTPYLIMKLESGREADVTPAELKSWVKYETFNWR